MKVYAINLERAVERRRHIVRHLEKLNLNYELIKAIDGTQPTEEELERLCDLEAVRARPHKLTPGAIGCALSHLKAYRKMLADNEDLAMIVEDDAILPKNIQELLKQIQNNLEEGEVIMLYYNCVPGETPVLSKLNAVSLNNRTSLLYPVNFPMSTAGYVISRAAAQALSETILPIRVEADDWEYFYKNERVKSLRCVHPRLLEITQAETQVQACTFEGISFRHKIWRLISNHKIPILYPLACRYLRLKERKTPIELVDAPSIVSTRAGLNMPESLFRNSRYQNRWH